VNGRSHGSPSSRDDRRRGSCAASTRRCVVWSSRLPALALKQALALVTIAVLAAALATVTGATAQEQGAGPALRLATTTPPVEPDGPFTLRLRVDGAASFDGLAVRVSVHPCICNRGRRAFTRGLDRSGLGSPIRVPGSLPLTALPREVDGSVTVTMPSNELGLRSTAAVYPVTVALDGPDGELDRLLTHLVRLPAGPDRDATPLSVAWIQPVEAPPALQPDGEVDLERDGPALEALATALARSDVPVTLAPGPETLDALAEARPEALDALRRATEGRTVLARPYVDVDVEELIGSDLGGEVADAVQRGAAVLLGQLGSVDVEGRTWWADDRLGVPGLDALRFVGLERAVVPEERLEPRDPSPLFTPTAPFALGEDDTGAMPAVGLDPDLQAHFDGGDDPVLAADHLLADLSVLYLDAPGFDARGVAVAPPRGRTTDAALVRAALDGLEVNPLLRPVSLGELFTGVPAEEEDGDPLVRTMVDPPPPVGEPDPTQLRQLRQASDSLALLSGPLDPEVNLVRRMLLLSSASAADAGRRRAYLEGAAARVAGRRDSVGLVDPGGFTLTAREGTIPLTLTARPPFPLQVCLRLTSDKLDFLDDPGSSPGRYDRPMTLSAENTPVEVRVRARTPGAFPLDVEVRSCDGRLKLGASEVTVRATAPSGLGLVLSGGAGAFLLVWWARHWRTVRRRRRLVAAPAG
jgi:Family of unknown function (DUF6049)